MLKDQAKLFVIIAFLWIATMFIIAYVSPPVQWNYSYSEAPLSKLAQIPFAPGDNYTYEISSVGGSALAQIRAANSAYCHGILLYDAKYANTPSLRSASVCIDNWGNQLSQDGSIIGSNLSYGNISWPFFAPWMLAVDENWSWSASSTLIAGQFETFSTTHMRFAQIGKENYLGREGYLVSISAAQTSGGEYGEISRLLIDKETRVLLYSNSASSQVRLLSAPFNLTAQN